MEKLVLEILRQSVAKKLAKTKVHYIYVQKWVWVWVYLEINFPSPSRHNMGANAPQWKGQDRTQDRTQIFCIFEEGRGWLHLEINFPSPSRHYMGANAPRWEHNTTQMCAKYPGGGGDGQPQTLNRVMNQFW